LSLCINLKVCGVLTRNMNADEYFNIADELEEIDFHNRMAAYFARQKQNVSETVHRSGAQKADGAEGSTGARLSEGTAFH